VSEIPVTCGCGSKFEVAESFRNGLVNCPQCGKATEVGGGPEPLFWILLAIGISFVLGLSGLLWVGVGPVAGGIALGIGAAVVAIFVMAS
jgi:hypothetical protein